MKAGIIDRMKKLEARYTGPGPMAMIVQPREGETDPQAKVRTLAEHPELERAPVVILRLNREAPCETNI
jgi:hypothetical protein